jgi:hypothetical protein
MPDQPARRQPRAVHPLWFLGEPDALVRRFILRTVLERPVALRRMQPRGIKR